MSGESAALSIIVSVLDEKKACDVKVIDVRGKTSLADHFVVCHATSATHGTTLVEAVRRACREAGLVPYGSDVSPPGEWMVLDYGDVILHLFLEVCRFSRLQQDPTVSGYEYYNYD